MAYTTPGRPAASPCGAAELCGIWHGAMFNYGRVVLQGAPSSPGPRATQSPTAANTKLLPPFAYDLRARRQRRRRWVLPRQRGPLQQRRDVRGQPRKARMTTEVDERAMTLAAERDTEVAYPDPTPPALGGFQGLPARPGWFSQHLGTAAIGGRRSATCSVTGWGTWSASGYTNIANSGRELDRRHRRAPARRARAGCSGSGPSTTRWPRSSGWSPAPSTSRPAGPGTSATRPTTRWSASST